MLDYILDSRDLTPCLVFSCVCVFKGVLIKLQSESLTTVQCADFVQIEQLLTFFVTGHCHLLQMQYSYEEGTSRNLMLAS